MKRNALLQKKGSQNETSQDVLDEEDDDVRTTNVRASVATVEAAGQQRTTPKQPSSAKNLPPTSLFQGEPLAGETAHHQPFKEPPRNSIFQGEPWNLRASAEQKMVGLKDYGMNQSVYAKRQQMAPSTSSKASKAPNVRSVEELEDIARQKATKNSFRLLLLGNIAAVKVSKEGVHLVSSRVLATISEGDALDHSIRGPASRIVSHAFVPLATCTGHGLLLDQPGNYYNVRCHHHFDFVLVLRIRG